MPVVEQVALNAPVAGPDADSRPDLDRSALLAMDHGRLHALAAEIRTLLVGQVCASGGQLGVNLGAAGRAPRTAGGGCPQRQRPFLVSLVSGGVQRVLPATPADLGVDFSRTG